MSETAEPIRIDAEMPQIYEKIDAIEIKGTPDKPMYYGVIEMGEADDPLVRKVQIPDPLKLWGYDTPEHTEDYEFRKANPQVWHLLRVTKHQQSEIDELRQSVTDLKNRLGGSESAESEVADRPSPKATDIPTEDQLPSSTGAAEPSPRVDREPPVTIRPDPLAYGQPPQVSGPEVETVAVPPVESGVRLHGTEPIDSSASPRRIEDISMEDETRQPNRLRRFMNRQAAAGSIAINSRTDRRDNNESRRGRAGWLIGGAIVGFLVAVELYEHKWLGFSSVREIRTTAQEQVTVLQPRGNVVDRLIDTERFKILTTEAKNAAAAHAQDLHKLNALQNEVHHLATEVHNQAANANHTNPNVHVSNAAEKFSSYQYPWDWAHKVYGATAETKLHELSDKAANHGHKVKWIQNGFLPNGSRREILQIDGTTNSQTVLGIVSRYR